MPAIRPFRRSPLLAHSHPLPAGEAAQGGPGRRFAQRTGTPWDRRWGGVPGLSARALRARSTAHLRRRAFARWLTQCPAPRPCPARPLGRRCAVAAPAGSRRSAPEAAARCNGQGRTSATSVHPVYPPRLPERCGGRGPQERHRVAGRRQGIRPSGVEVRKEVLHGHGLTAFWQGLGASFGSSP
jgi:hypothetical protein